MSDREYQTKKTPKPRGRKILKTFLIFGYKILGQGVGSFVWKNEGWLKGFGFFYIHKTISN